MRIRIWLRIPNTAPVDLSLKSSDADLIPYLASIRPCTWLVACWAVLAVSANASELGSDSLQKSYRLGSGHSVLADPFKIVPG
jgi:hypothetical protein